MLNDREIITEVKIDSDLQFIIDTIKKAGEEQIRREAELEFLRYALAGLGEIKLALGFQEFCEKAPLTDIIEHKKDNLDYINKSFRG